GGHRRRRRIRSARPAHPAGRALAGGGGTARDAPDALSIPREHPPVRARTVSSRPRSSTTVRAAPGGLRAAGGGGQQGDGRTGRDAADRGAEARGGEPAGGSRVVRTGTGRSAPRPGARREPESVLDVARPFRDRPPAARGSARAG